MLEAVFHEESLIKLVNFTERCWECYLLVTAYIVSVFHRELWEFAVHCGGRSIILTSGGICPLFLLGGICCWHWIRSFFLLTEVSAVKKMCCCSLLLTSSFFCKAVLYLSLLYRIFKICWVLVWWFHFRNCFLELNSKAKVVFL